MIVYKFFVIEFGICVIFVYFVKLIVFCCFGNFFWIFLKCVFLGLVGWCVYFLKFLEVWWMECMYVNNNRMIWICILILCFNKVVFEVDLVVFSCYLIILWIFLVVWFYLIVILFFCDFILFIIVLKIIWYIICDSYELCFEYLNFMKLNILKLINFCI